MDDRARMIAAARRSARRIAKKTELTYQQALDRVARDLGRDHWAHYASDPVPVPRDVQGPDLRTEVPGVAAAPVVDERIRDDGHSTFLLAGRDWNALRPGLEGWLAGTPFLPAWNALASEHVGRKVSELDREAHVKAIAHILIPDRAASGNRYFDDKGRQALEGFLLAEVFRSWREDREATIPALVDWISADVQVAGGEARIRNEQAELEGRLPVADGMRSFLASVCDAVREEGRSARAFTFLSPLVDMASRERSGVLGTMDQGLLPFRNPVVRAMNS